MPTLQFKGKNIIWNHHLSVPYHTLDEAPELNFNPEKANGNLIIEGDNLLALKALLPHYAGKIKCIYIDPPYNTGNEGWIYNDNVNSPLMKEWLGKEVGKDDLTRHDKWLCMMVPRLKLLRELLTDDGVIFISIDDNEVHHLRSIFDEISPNSFIIEFIWEKKKKPSFLKKSVGIRSDYILCYIKNPEKAFPFSIEKTEEGKKIPLNNAGNGISVIEFPAESVFFDMEDQVILPQDMSEGNIITHLLDKLIVENGTNINSFRLKGEWRYGQDMINKIIEDDEQITIAKIPFRPNYIRENIDNKKMSNLLTRVHYNMETNEDATKQIRDLFGRDIFKNPKPVKLIKTLIKCVTYNSMNSIILDSFAGSGTTMHAVMDLNKEDGGRRRCIMVQMTEATPKEPNKNICKDITRERVKRAIEKYGYDSGFKYLRVGIPIDAETLLSGDLPTYQQFAEYVYYLCTGEILEDKAAVDEKTYYVGRQASAVIYLVYRQNYEELMRLALNLPLAEEIIARHPQKRLIIYAPACFLEEEYMREKAIEFVGIPYNLFRRS